MDDKERRRPRGPLRGRDPRQRSSWNPVRSRPRDLRPYGESRDSSRSDQRGSMTNQSVSRPSVPMRTGFLERQVDPRPTGTNRRMAEAVIRDLDRNERRGTLDLLKGCVKVSANVLEDPNGIYRGRPSKHPKRALLCVLLSRYLWTSRKSALLSREDVVLKV